MFIPVWHIITNPQSAILLLLKICWWYWFYRRSYSIQNVISWFLHLSIPYYSECFVAFPGHHATKTCILLTPTSLAMHMLSSEDNEVLIFDVFAHNHAIYENTGGRDIAYTNSQSVCELCAWRWIYVMRTLPKNPGKSCEFLWSY